VWKPELTGSIFPIYSSDILTPLIGWSPSGQFLNTALIVCTELSIRIKPKFPSVYSQVI
jgi:hypothetical protein